MGEEYDEEKERRELEDDRQIEDEQVHQEGQVPRVEPKEHAYSRPHRQCGAARARHFIPCTEGGNAARTCDGKLRTRVRGIWPPLRKHKRTKAS